MKEKEPRLVSLETDYPIWNRFFTVSPLVLVGTREVSGKYDLAPKHMAFPMGLENYFGFACTERHHTYTNAKREGTFTVSYPRPSQFLVTSLAAGSRCGDDSKPGLLALDTFPARQVDGVLVRNAYLHLECSEVRIVDGFGSNSLVTGKVVAVHLDEEALRANDKDDRELIRSNPLLAYLHPGRFATIEHTVSFPFPSDFKG